jgi:hypothetical protein
VGNSTKIAWIGLIATIGAAIIGGVFALMRSSDPPPPKPVVEVGHDVKGDVVVGNKTVNQNIIAEEDRSYGKITITDITERDGLDLDGYKVFQSLKLTSHSNGIKGALLILIDDRLDGIDGRFSYDQTGEALIPTFYSDSKIYDMESKGDFKRALLIIVNEKLGIEYYDQLGKETVRLDKIYIDSGSLEGTFVLTRDYSIGMGSYNGPASYFFKVGPNGFNYLFNRQPFATTLKSKWLIYSGEILYRRCRPDFKHETTDSVPFINYFERRYYKNGVWKEQKWEKSGFWEYDDTLPSFGVSEFYSR